MTQCIFMIYLTINIHVHVYMYINFKAKVYKSMAARSDSSNLLFTNVNMLVEQQKTSA